MRLSQLSENVQSKFGEAWGWQGQIQSISFFCDIFLDPALYRSTVNTFFLEDYRLKFVHLYSGGSASEFLRLLSEHIISACLVEVKAIF